MSVYFILQEEASGAIKAANAGKIVSPTIARCFNPTKSGVGTLIVRPTVLTHSIFT